MRKLILAMAITTAPVTAMATTVGLAYDNVGLNAGQGNAMTLPGGKISLRQPLGAGFGVLGDFVGAGGKNDATFYGVRAEGYKLIPFDGGYFRPGIDAGYNRLNIVGSHASAAYAGVRVAYVYPLNRDVSIKVDGGFGRDFATSVSGLSTIGGLTYDGGAQAAFRVGPGALDVGYQYRHLPLSSAYDLHLNTGQFTVGYKMAF